MRATGSQRARGFTLIELVIALAVSLLVIAGGLALMSAQQRTYRATSDDRALQEAARVALGHVGDNLRLAGFGVDPALAFDLGPMNNVRMDRAYNGQAFSTSSAPTGAGAACTGLCRDSATGPDEVVFYSRDPAFGPHPLTVAATAASSSLTVAGPLGVALQPGQVLQVACYTGAMTWAYVQVRAAPVDNGDGTFTIPITSSASSTFPQQNAWLADACFGSVATLVGKVVNAASLGTAAEVFKVDRYHYFIQSYDAAGNVVAWGTAGSRPYLMLDQGLKDAHGALQVSVVEPDVEDLQLAYVFPGDAVAPLVGATAGVGLSNDDAGVNLAPAAGPPIYSDAASAATRQNHHPGNIGAVRVAVVVRSPQADLSIPGGDALPAAGNRPATTGAAGYRRLLLQSTFAVRNLSTLAPYFPTWGTATAAPGNRQLNVGGG